MARPAKKRRFSPITIGPDKFRWRFDGKLHVLAEADTSRRGQRLVVDWGWIDWCEPDHRSDETRGPNTVTPSFVRSAIEFALLSGWTPNDSAADLNINYSGGVFSVQTKTTEQCAEPKSR